MHSTRAIGDYYLHSNIFGSHFQSQQAVAPVSLLGDIQRYDMKKMILTVLSLFALQGCNRIDSLLWQPKMTPKQWCESMPCVELFSSGLTLTQPTSTLLIYFLGGLWLWVGWRFSRTGNGQKSRRWWAIAMTLGGFAAIAAGTSYQAFGFELKCADREFCTWTSWWEIAYLALQMCSVNAMLAGVAYACTTGPMRRLMLAYAAMTTVVYCSVTAIGTLLPNKFMISFEMLVLFSTPALTTCFVINGWRYFEHKTNKDKVLLGAWGIMFGTNVLYFAYLLLGYTQTLWSKGFWFSANDVLHVLMLVWVWYVGTAVVRVLDDADPQSVATNISL